MEKLIIELRELRSKIDHNQQRLFSLNSINNFLLSYNKLSTSHKMEVERLLFEYFQIMKDYDYSIDINISTNISFSHILKIGRYYRRDLNFKLQMTLQFALIIGVFLDFLLLIIFYRNNIYLAFLGTLMMFTYWAYLKIFYERKYKVYAMRY